MRSAIGGMVITGLMCGVALAQNTQNQNVQPGANAGQRLQAQLAQPGQLRAGQAGQAEQGQAQTDQQIAHCIYGGCHNEVELAKFVQSKLQSKEAKHFAEMMIKDHTPDCEAYKKWAGDLVAHHAGQTQGGHGNWIRIHEELAQQCLETSKHELGKKQGAELDQCYLTHQAMAHVGMKDKLTVLKKHASPQLAQQIDKSLEGVESHLKEVKQILEQMKDSPSERVSRRPEGNK